MNAGSSDFPVGIVDADRGRRAKVHDVLTSNGYTCTCFSSGPELFCRTEGDISCMVAAYEMPSMNGMELFHCMQHRGWSVPTVLLGNGMNVRAAVDAMTGGIAAILPMPLNFPEVVTTLDEIREENRRCHEQSIATVELRRRIDLLTSRQSAVLQMATRGETNKVIARELGISVRTVEYRKREAYSKLGVHNLAEATIIVSQINRILRRYQSVVDDDESVLNLLSPCESDHAISSVN